MTTIKKKIILLLLILSTIIVYFILELVFSKDKVVFLSVGQGDAVLLSVAGNNILIDGGPDWEVIKGLDRNLPFLNRTLDVIILSHAHHDHFIGLAEVIRRYKVKKIYYYHHNFTDIAYREMILTLNTAEVEMINILDVNSLLIENCNLNFLWPFKEISDKSDLNDLSIVAKFNCKNLSFLFTGDITEAVEKLLITHKKNLSADVLKACHHGSKYSNSLSFLRQVNPEIIVFTVGKANRYGFPSKETVLRVEKEGIKIKSTENKKDVVFNL